MTLVMIITQSKRSLLFLRPRSTPFAHTYQLAAMTKMGRNPMKRKRLEVVGTLCERTGLALCRSRCEERPQDSHHRAYTQGSPELDCRTLVPSNSTAVLCAPSTSRRAFASHSSIDSFGRGVNSLESMASLTLYGHRRAASRQEWWFWYYDALGGLWFVYEYKNPFGEHKHSPSDTTSPGRGSSVWTLTHPPSR